MLPLVRAARPAAYREQRMSTADRLRTLVEGRRILVAEDETLVALALKGILSTCGAVVIGPAAKTDDAAALADDPALDCAILDINLNGRLVYEVAERLRARGVPMIFATGYSGLDALPEPLQDVPVVIKPYDLSQLAVALGNALG